MAANDREGSTVHSVNPAKEFWQRRDPPAGYPKGVVGIPAPIVGTAFFPGGYGLWRTDVLKPLPKFPLGGIMVLGHDFHSEEGYRKSLLAGHESTSQPTWRNLIRVFDEVPIDPRRCFFTNVYVGLRAGKHTTGPFPGSSDPAFVKHCEAFLLHQLEVMRPSVIITFGINVPPFLSRLAADLADWGTRVGLKYLDDVGPVRKDVEFPGDPPFKSTVVALSHPSLRHSNLRYRHYRNQTEHAAEIMMLRDALKP